MIRASGAARRSPISELLGATGPVGQALPGYEERPGQLEMANMVLRALNKGGHAVVEAGTGTGKSLAYLVPIIYSGKTVIVSTANKALQEQLIRKDIPFLRKVLPIQFEAAVLKGRGNYLCLDRLREEAAFQRMMGGTRGWARLLEWKEDTTTGDFEDLDITLPGDLRGKEAKKIDCGKAHFAALGVDYKVVTSHNEI